MDAPPAKPRQRMLALKKANEVRTARARLHERVLRREIDFDQVIAEPPTCVRNMPVFDLLLWAPRYGHVRAQMLLNRVRVSATRPVGKLTARERREIRKMIAG